MKETFAIVNISLLVFPAASKPNIKIRISLLPNIFDKAFDRLAPIFIKIFFLMF